MFKGETRSLDYSSCDSHRGANLSNNKVGWPGK